MVAGSDKKTVQQIQKELAEPFDPFDIEWRVQQAGETNGKKWALVLAYVTNRAIMERLDDVFGIDGWQNEYQPMPDGGIICGLKCKVPIGLVPYEKNGVVKATEGFEWITKYDGADKTAIEATKGGLSNAMKRAGVQWGIGRYLYRLETTFVTLLEEKPMSGDYIPAFVKMEGQQKGRRYWFERPNLPKFALPGGLNK